MDGECIEEAVKQAAEDFARLQREVAQEMRPVLGPDDDDEQSETSDDEPTAQDHAEPEAGADASNSYAEVIDSYEPARPAETDDASVEESEPEAVAAGEPGSRLFGVGSVLRAVKPATPSDTEYVASSLHCCFPAAKAARAGSAATRAAAHFIDPFQAAGVSC